jgi:acetyl esterase
MPLHPDAVAYIAQMAELGFRDYPELGVEGARAQQEKITAAIAPPKTGRSEDREIAGPGGPLPIRIFYPEGVGPHPLLMAFHGGGWVLGNLESNDAFCRYLAREVGCMIISVNYRHAPEHKFPAPVEDANAATLWAVAQAEALSADPARIGVYGTSAGANLAAAVTLMARDRGGPALTCQLLIVPAASARTDTASYAAAEGGPVLSAEAMRWFWSLYLASVQDGEHPYASPLLADDLSGLPRAIVVTAEFDPLRDEGTAYATALADAGVPVIHRDYSGMVHAFRGAQSNVDVVMGLRAAFAAA